MLIVMTGAPGLGKSTLAEALARRFDGLLLHIDTIEAGLAASELELVNAMDAGYRVAVGVAVDNLALGRTVIADAVNGWLPAQDWWRLAAAQTDNRLVVLQPVVPLDLHRARVEARHAENPATPDWETVCARDIAPWPGAHPVDMSGTVEAAVAQVEALLSDEDVGA